MRRVILASSSRYRQTQLAVLGLPFDSANPDIDETPYLNEAPDVLAQRLALAKTNAVANNFPEALIIGSDQVAFCEGQTLGKPGSPEAAFQQLSALQGKTVLFFTAVALHDTQNRQSAVEVVSTEVRYRELTENQIRHYLSIDSPYDCAGSFKSESLGIALLEHVSSNDPTALIGLPLIALTRLLTAAGVDVLASRH
jgi:septum formation protein